MRESSNIWNIFLTRLNPRNVAKSIVMKITVDRKPTPQVEAEALIVPVFEGRRDARFGAGDLFDSGEIAGKPLELTLLHHAPGVRVTRVLLAGGGKPEKFDAAEMRRLSGAAVRYLKAKSIKTVALALDPEFAGDDFASAAIEGAILGDFEPDRYKTGDDKKSIDAFALAADTPGLDAAVHRGQVLAEAQNFTRDLVNEPGNRMTPTILADRAKKMCDETGLKCEISGGDKIKELKMGAFWSVAQGSDEEPRLIVMRHEPAGAPEKPVLGLVGKGITFDSGGISIKPGDGMEKMKYDMAGGAAMIGAMRAIAQLKANLRVIGIVCASENMPSGKAQKPGDVQIAMSGKSIEIINTDAEGRLVLADGLHYARQLGCTHLIDAATLTGACVVALGMVNAGIFANDEDFYERFSKSLQKSGEKMWRLPVDEEYRDMIKSNIADIVNSGGRWGGAVTAAMFLKEFVGDTPWLHLDIAGVAWMEDNKPWIAKGPSGIPVRSLVEFVRDLAAGPLSKN